MSEAGILVCFDCTAFFDARGTCLASREVVEVALWNDKEASVALANNNKLDAVSFISFEVVSGDEVEVVLLADDKSGTVAFADDKLEVLSIANDEANAFVLSGDEVEVVLFADNKSGTVVLGDGEVDVVSDGADRNEVIFSAVLRCKGQIRIDFDKQLTRD